ncbi:M48 family metallopeptidase [bacterium]|nr:M48 family metallopeptidase [bacterium]
MEVKIIKSKKRLKSFSARILENTLIVRVPHWSPQFSIDEFVNKSIQWASKKTKGRTTISLSKGSKVTMLGAEYLIEDAIKKGRNRVSIKDNLITIEYTKTPHEAFIKYVKTVLKNYLQIASKDYAEEIDEIFNKITVKRVSSIWGSCSSKQNLNYNYKLAFCPLWVIDYVVAHEVCHLKHKNHSKRFWDLVESLHPKYKTAKKWLNENGSNLSLS